MLWDCGLEPGHSVRTVAECVEEAAKDVTVDTSLLESRARRRQRRRCVRRARRAPARAAQRARLLRGEVPASRSAATSASRTRPTTSSPTSRKAPGDCATCRWCCGSRAPRASATSWKELADQGLITPREAGAHHQERARAAGPAHPPALPRRAARGPPRLRPPDRDRAPAEAARAPGRIAPSDLLMRHYYLAAKAIWRFNQILLANLVRRA